MTSVSGLDTRVSRVALHIARFDIGGMHCAACASRNERTLKNLPGVREAAVNFALRSARVEFDPSLVSERALHERIVDNGFQVLTSEFAKDNQQQTQRELSQARWRAVAALVLSAPVMLLAMLEIELPWSVAGRNASLWLQAALSSIVIWVSDGRFIAAWSGSPSGARPIWTHAHLPRHALGAALQRVGAVRRRAASLL